MSNKIILVELNYQVSPLKIRETISSQHEEIQQTLSDRLEGGVFVLSTCHRYAILAFESSEDTIVRTLQAKCPPLTKDDLLVLEGQSAAAHFFSTACGLHSRTVGEHEILGQVRNAFRKPARRCAELNELIKRTIFTGKRARTETFIGRYSTSLSAITGDRIEQHFPNLQDVSVMLFGTGEMAQLVLKRLKQLEVGKIAIVSKDVQRAAALCESSNISAITPKYALKHWNQYEVVIGATWTPEHLLCSAQDGERTRRQLLVDLGMPRNFDPMLAEHPELTLLDLDSVNREVHDSIQKRHHEITRVHDIIEEEIEAFNRWLEFRAFVPQIKKLKSELSETEAYFISRASTEFYLGCPQQAQTLIYTIHGIVQAHFSQIIDLYRANVAECFCATYTQEIKNGMNEALESLFQKNSKAAA